MQGCKHSRQSWFAMFLSLMVAGCGSGKPPADYNAAGETPSTERKQADDERTGTLSGRVTWEGPLPSVPSLQPHSPALFAGGGVDSKPHPNPNAPTIAARTRAVKNAIVFLRGVDTSRARPWDLPPVQIELRDFQFHVYQGSADCQAGFVQRGTAVEMVSRDQAFNAVQLTGASFFSIPFPDADRPVRRCLNDSGLVELSSAAGYYWMRAYLFVDEHPYYARTDKLGNFQLEEVPPGCFEVVCWLPGWSLARLERDPEIGYVSRLVFSKPLESRQAVLLHPGQVLDIPLVMHGMTAQP